MTEILTFMAAHSRWNFRIFVAKDTGRPGRIAVQASDRDLEPLLYIPALAGAQSAPSPA
jgi:hypothetical protein